MKKTLIIILSLAFCSENCNSVIVNPCSNWMDATWLFIQSHCEDKQVLYDTLTPNFHYKQEEVFTTLHDYIEYRTKFRIPLLSIIGQVAEITETPECKITEYYNEQSSKAIISVATRDIEQIESLNAISSENIHLEIVSKLQYEDDLGFQCILAGDQSILNSFTVITEVSKDKQFVIKFISMY